MRAARQVVVCLIVAAIVPTAAQAQTSARDREAAGQAYDRGTAAYLEEDFERAAQWFETAHRLAPAAAALVQAVRANDRAGNAQRAATLALRLQALYPDDRAATRTAERALENAGDFLRVDVECDEECTIEVGDSVMGHTSFFLLAGTDQEVTASFETGNRSEHVSGEAGETVSLRFEAPEPEPETQVVAGPDPVGSTEQSDDGGGGGVPLAVTLISLAVTAGVGGVLIWSGIDTLSGVDAYEEAAADDSRLTEAMMLLASGRAAEERTNWLIAGTAVAGTTTALLMIFTDWGGGDSSEAEEAEDGEIEVDALLDVQPSGVFAGLRGRF